MKKLLSISLVLSLLLFSTSCATENIQYKTITFKHAEILQEKLELTIPNDWIYEEICDGNDLIKFYSYEDYTEIGNVTINQFYNAKSGFYENRKEFVPLEDATYNKINEDCFIATDKGKGNIICYRINDVEAIDIFINISAEQKTVKNIAKNIISTKIEIDKNTHSEVQATEQKTDFKPLDISFLDDENYVYSKKTYEQAYSVFLTIDSLAEIAKKTYVFTSTTMGNRSFVYTVEVDENNTYGIIEDYLLKELLFVKYIIKDGQQNDSSYEILDRKPFTADTSLVNTWDAKMMQNGFQKTMLKIETIDKIIETNNLYEFIKNGTVEISWFDNDTNPNYFKTDFYVPELKAYFHVAEDYDSKTAHYGISRIDPKEDNSIPQEYWKYNVYKPLSPNADINNYKGLVG